MSRSAHFVFGSIGAWSAFLLCLCAGSAMADSERAREEARQHFQAGQAAYVAGDLRLAISEFVAADTLVPSPILSFNVGFCHEKLGEDDHALSAYRQYLVRRPDAPNRAEVEAKIATLAERIAAEKTRAGSPATPELYEALDEPPGAALPPLTVVPSAPSQGRSLGPEAKGAWVDPHRAPSRAVPAAQGVETSPPLVEGAEAAPSAPPGSGSLGDPLPNPSVVSDRPSGPPAPMPPAEGGRPRAPRPFYKEWKFWAVVGVAAIIFVGMSESRSRSSQARNLEGGAVLLQF